MYLMCMAFVASLRSEDPIHRVGAVGATKRGRIIGTGYNGLAAGREASPRQWKDDAFRLTNTIHAEINLISMTPPNVLKTVAVTTFPCLSCAKALIAHDVKKIIFGQVYHRAPEVVDLVKEHGIEVCHIPLESVLKTLQKIGLKLR
jgi:deoxycytidylate deaminase